MTHEERLSYLRALPGETISSTELAKLLGGNAYSYNKTAKAGNLMLPHTWCGNRLRIFVAPLIKILEGGNPNDYQPDSNC